MKKKSTRYRYITYKKGKSMVPWTLVEETTIPRLVGRHPVDFFVTIQDYDEKGEDKQCPIYIDLDGETAHDDAIQIAASIQEKFNVIPDIYFSGSKGFHLIIPFIVKGDNCEKVVKEWLELILCLSHYKSWDRSIYKARTMFRLVNSKNSKSGLFKIPLTQNELESGNIAEIRESAALPRYGFFPSSPMTELSVSALSETIEIVRQDLQKESCPRPVILPSKGGWKEQISPCLMYAIKTRPEDGEWHNMLFSIARFFKVCGESEEACLKVLLKEPHWQEDEKYVKKTVKGVYKWNNTSPFGTHQSVVSKYCVSNLCKYCRKD